MLQRDLVVVCFRSSRSHSQRESVTPIEAVRDAAERRPVSAVARRGRISPGSSTGVCTSLISFISHRPALIPSQRSTTPSPTPSTLAQLAAPAPSRVREQRVCSGQPAHSSQFMSAAAPPLPPLGHPAVLAHRHSSIGHSRSLSEQQLLSLHLAASTEAAPTHDDTALSDSEMALLFPPLETSVFETREAEFAVLVGRALQTLDQSDEEQDPVSGGWSSGFDVTPVLPETPFFRDSLYSTSPGSRDGYSFASSSSSGGSSSSSMASSPDEPPRQYGSRYTPPPLCPTPVLVPIVTSSSLAVRRAKKTSINLELLMLGSQSGGLDGRGIDGAFSRRESGGFTLGGQHSPLGGTGSASSEGGEEELTCPLTPELRRRVSGGFIF